MKILNPKKLPFLKYNWEHNYIFPYESLWSILQKFATWNSCDAIEIWGEFKRINYKYPTGSRKVISEVVLDEHKISSMLKLKKGTVKRGKIQHYIFDYEVKYLALTGTLRFCPECVNSGYHSPIHQLLFLRACPYHGYILIDKCPGCTEGIHTQFTSKSASPPYGCPQCGYILSSKSEFNIDPQRDEAYRLVTQWLNARKRTHIQNKANIEGWVGSYSSSVRNKKINTLPYIWSGCVGRRPPFKTSNVPSIYRNQKEEMAADILAGVDRKCSVGRINSIYRLTVNKIIDEHLGGHFECAESIVKCLWWSNIYKAVAVEREICVLGAAFVMWRMFCEGIPKITKLKTAMEGSWSADPQFDFSPYRNLLSDELIYRCFLSLFYRCVVLQRFWKIKSVLRFDLRFLETRHMPYCQVERSESGQNFFSIWSEEGLGKRYLSSERIKSHCQQELRSYLLTL